MINIDDYKMIKFHSNFSADYTGWLCKTIVIINEKYADEYTYGPSHPYKVKLGRSTPAYLTIDHINNDLLPSVSNGYWDIVEFVKA